MMKFQKLQKRLKNLFWSTANITKLAVSPRQQQQQQQQPFYFAKLNWEKINRNYPSFSLLLVPVSNVFELTTTSLLLCASRNDVTLAAFVSSEKIIWTAKRNRLVPLTKHETNKIEILFSLCQTHQQIVRHRFPSLVFLSYLWLSLDPLSERI